MADLIDDLVDLLYPLPDRARTRLVDVNEYGDDDRAAEDAAFHALHDDVAQQRREFEDGLRALQNASPLVLDPGAPPIDVDPLIAEVQRAHAEQQAAESRLRLLLAYAREYTPFTYSLAQLGRAAGISGSGVRNVYTWRDTGRVFQLLAHRTPFDIVGLRGDAGPHECAVIAGKRNQRAVNCAGAPTTIGGAHGTDQQFTVCTPHSYLVLDAHPVPDPSSHNEGQAAHNEASDEAS